MECFSISAQEIDGRLDSFYYRKEFKDLKKRLDSSKFKTFKLGDITEKISDGTHFTPNYIEEGIPFIGVRNVRRNAISFRTCKFISQKEHIELSKRCVPKEGDILLTKIGATYGLSAVVPEDMPECSIFVSLALIRLKSNINPYFVMHFLNSPDGYSQMKRFVKGIGQPDLHLEDIKKIRIPLPPIDIQNKMVELMNGAYIQRKKRAMNTSKLLESINSLLLNKLEINLPELKNKLSYSIDSKKVKNNRMDTYYYQPKFEQVNASVMKSKYEIKTIGDLEVLGDSENISNYEYINYIDLSSINKFFGKIVKFTRMDINSAPGRARQKIEEGDLLISSLVGSLKSIAIFDGGIENAICSTGFYVIKKSKEYNNYYLWGLFRTPLFQLILGRESSGAIMSSINMDSLKKINIPLPPISVQNKIAEEIKSKLKDAEMHNNESITEFKRIELKIERDIIY